MALPLGKLTIIVGAGILGSVLTKEGRMSDVTGFLSGAFKIVVKQIQKDGSASSTKPSNDALLAQVNNLRKELQGFASDSSVMIITGGRSGAGTYGVPVVIILGIGYAYIWWKGWKLSALMFATRGGLSDARTAVGNQFDQLSSSISQAKQFLSSRVDRVDIRLDECLEITAAIKEEISEVRGQTDRTGIDVEYLYRVMEPQEARLVKMSRKQDLFNKMLEKLCSLIWEQEQNKISELVEASPSSSSRPALELPQITPASRMNSLPPRVVSREPPSPSAPKVSRQLQSAVVASGLKELQGLTDAIVEPSTGPEVIDNGIQNPDGVKSNVSMSNSRRAGWRFPGLNAFVLTRTQSATFSK